jgi:hypothetical protein
VGWAGDPVPSIEEKDFCKRSIEEIEEIEESDLISFPVGWE